MSARIDQGLALVARRLGEDRHLAVLVTTRPGRDDPSIAVVNAAVIEHPAHGGPVVAFVARPGTKLVNLRRRPRATLVARSGWEWVAVAGTVELSGPDDLHPDIGLDDVPVLLRAIYQAAGGQHSQIDIYDQVMHDERRCVVLVNPERIWTNPPGSEHIDP